MGRVLVIFLLALVAGAALYWSQRPSGPFFVSGFIEADEIRVGSRVGGRVQEVFIQEGRPVTRGEPMIRLEPFDLTERLSEARASLSASQAVLNKLKAGYRAEEIAQAQARVERYQAILNKAVAGPRPLEIQILQDKVDLAKADLINAESEHARVKKLYDEQKAAQQEMDDVLRLLNAAQARFAVAEDELALAKEGTRAEEIAEARAGLAEARQALALAEKGYRPEEIQEAVARTEAAQAAVSVVQRQVEELTISSPVDGLVEAVDLQPGDLIGASAPVISLIDKSRLWVRAYVPENRLNLTVGRKVSVRVDSFPGRRFAGAISFISRQAEFTPANVQTPEERSKQVFRIKVMLDEGLDVLRPGMSADVFLEPVP